MEWAQLRGPELRPATTRWAGGLVGVYEQQID